MVDLTNFKLCTKFQHPRLTNKLINPGEKNTLPGLTPS